MDNLTAKRILDHHKSSEQITLSRVKKNVLSICLWNISFVQYLWGHSMCAILVGTFHVCNTCGDVPCVQTCGDIPCVQYLRGHLMRVNTCGDIPCVQYLWGQFVCTILVGTVCKYLWGHRYTDEEK